MADIEMAILELIHDGGPQSAEDLVWEFRETIWRLHDQGLINEDDSAGELLHLTEEGLQYVREDIGDV